MRASRKRFPGLRVMLGAAVVVLMAIGLAVPASAADVTPQKSGDAVVVMSGEVVVNAQETVGDVVVFDGPVTVYGHVDGSVVAFNGAVTIAGGTVSNDVTAFNGRVNVRAGSTVEGDIVSRYKAGVSEDATVNGTITRFSPNIFPMFGLIAAAITWLAVTLSLLIVGELLILVVPKLADRVRAAMTEATGRSVGLGFAVAIGLPVLAVIALMTIVGIPLGLLMLAAALVLIPIAYIVGALLLGQAIARKATPAIAFLIGFGILQLLSAIPFITGLVWAAASIIGMGALTLAAWRVAHPATQAQAVPHFAGGAPLSHAG